MTGFAVLKNMFNTKTSNKIFTRAEIKLYLKHNYNNSIKDSYVDTVRCYLTNAKYLKQEEPGVYRKLKKIPKDLTLTKLQDEAYPKTIEKRKRNRELARQFRF